MTLTVTKRVVYHCLSTWWPGHMPSTQDMQVEVKYRLPTISTGIGDNSIAGLAQTFLFRHVRACDKQSSQEPLIVGNAILYGHDMLFRTD